MSLKDFRRTKRHWRPFLSASTAELRDGCIPFGETVDYTCRSMFQPLKLSLLHVLPLLDRPCIDAWRIRARPIFSKSPPINRFPLYSWAE